VSNEGVGQIAGMSPSAPEYANSLLLQRVEALVAKVEGIAGSDALKAKGFVEKYWPIAAGILIALTRLL
jgi:hypothetical protein